MNRLLELRFARFSAVGLLATALHVGVAYGARAGFDLSPVAANATGFSIAFLFSYLGHHRFTFQRTGNHRRHLLRFLSLSLLSYLLSHAITVFVTGRLGLDYGLALAAILFVVPATTYLGGRYWAFATIGRPEAGQVGLWEAAGGTVAAVLMVAVFVWLRGTPFNHDTSWYFFATRTWMDGTPLYSGIMEINPPMPFYITRVVLGAGDLLGLADAEAFRLALFGLVAISLVLANAVLQGPPITPMRRAALLTAAAAGLLVTPLGVFGQREHLMIILALPYVAGVAMRNAGQTPTTGQAMLYAAFAAPGLLLKPYFLALPALATLLRVRQEGSLRPVLAADNLVIGAAAIAYLAAIVVFHPDYLETIIPLGRLVYFAFDGSARQVVLMSGLIYALSAALPMVLLEPTRAETGFAAGLGVALAAFAVSYLVQFKGFSYQLVPVFAAALLLAVWHVLVARDVRARAVAAVALALVATAALVGPVSTGPYRSDTALRLQQVLGDRFAGKSVMVFTTNVSRAFPLVNMTGMTWTSRYPTQWIPPGAHVGLMETPAGEEQAPFARALDYALRTASEDLVSHKPALVIVDSREAKSYFGHHRFDWIRFMNRDTAFVAEWKNYRLDQSIPEFEIWRRVGR